MIATLQKRFAENRHRHPDTAFVDIEERLTEQILNKIALMEASGGEPDIVCLKDGRLIVCDFAKETPSGRRSVCYDETARLSRKKAPPADSALAQAERIGIHLLDEDLYRQLQAFDAFDLKTSSWILTPDDLRQKDGALFMERRYDEVFIYHNGADSYYSVRGWRGWFEL